MHCWVNKGAKGIALIDEDSFSGLKYVFDISDVHKARRIGRFPNLWEMREEHMEAVLSRLEKTYGDTDREAGFVGRIREIAGRIAEDSYKELASDMEYLKEGSFLEELDELNVEIRIRETLADSIAYTVLKRCGMEESELAEEINFPYIHEFNTVETLSQLGSNVSDLSKPINTSLREYPEYLEMEGGNCACVMFIRKYPNGLTDQFLNELTNMSFPLIYTMDVEPLDNDVAYQMVMKKYMSNERSINREQELKNENGDYSTNINYERRKQQRDTEEMLDRISSFDERLLYVGITIVIKASSREELEERTEKVRIIGKTHNMDIVLHSHRQLDALNTSLPTGARFVNTMRTITSEELSIFIPFNVQEIHDDLGYCYGFNKVSKNLIIGNRKLLKNGNGMVFGVPGSGKSYNEKSEMGQVLCFSKDDIIVVDPMGEYKGIAAAWGGQYINLTQSAENVFYVNPFHVPDEVPDIDRFVAEKAEFAYAICEQALKPAPLTSRHIAVIDKAVSSMYEEYFRKRKDKRRRKNRPESPTIPVMRNRIMELYDDNEAAKEIVEQLEVFADGTLDIFAREQSISDENRFTVYGFSELGKRMRAMAMLVMIESITAKIKYNQSDGVATWVYVDEMHELWGEEYSLHALEKMWREVRKRGGICTGMSRNLIDAKRNRSTKTMVSNSEFMLLLDQGTMDKEAVEDLFDISSEQLACVNGAEPGTGLIRFGDKIVPFDNTMEKDSSLYRLFNTNFHEMVKDKNVKQTVEK